MHKAPTLKRTKAYTEEGAWLKPLDAKLRPQHFGILSTWLHYCQPSSSGCGCCSFPWRWSCCLVAWWYRYFRFTIIHSLVLKPLTRTIKAIMLSTLLFCGGLTLMSASSAATEPCCQGGHIRNLLLAEYNMLEFNCGFLYLEHSSFSLILFL